MASESAPAKAASKRTLPGGLATLTLDEVALPEAPYYAFPTHTQPTLVQQKAFDLLGIDPARFVTTNLTG